MFYRSLLLPILVLLSYYLYKIHKKYMLMVMFIVG